MVVYEKEKSYSRVGWARDQELRRSFLLEVEVS